MNFPGIKLHFCHLNAPSSVHLFIVAHSRRGIFCLSQRHVVIFGANTLTLLVIISWTTTRSVRFGRHPQTKAQRRLNGKEWLKIEVVVDDCALLF